MRSSCRIWPLEGSPAPLPVHSLPPDCRWMCPATMLLCPPCLLYHDGLYPLELRTHINLPSLKLLLLRLFVKVMRKATHIVISIEIHSTCFCQELWLECCWTLSPEFHVLESGAQPGSVTMAEQSLMKITRSGVHNPWRDWRWSCGLSSCENRLLKNACDCVASHLASTYPCDPSLPLCTASFPFISLPSMLWYSQSSGSQSS